MAPKENTSNQVAPVRSGPQPLNPERPPALLSKYAKYLGKELKSIVVTYDSDGVCVEVQGHEGTEYESLKDAAIAEFKAKRNELNAPSNEERLRSLRNKFELRLNKEFPKEGGPKDGSEAEIQAFMDRLGFRERRALMMTQKQFEVQYPNGFTQA